MKADTPSGRSNPAVVDLVLAGGLLVVAVLSGVSVDEARPDTVEPDRWWQWALMVTPSVAVAFRRVRPVVVAVVAGLAQTLVWVNDLPEFLLALVVALYTASADGGRRGRVASAGIGLALTVVTAVGLRVAGDVSLYQVPLVALTCAVAIALGATSEQQRRRAGRLAADVTSARLQAAHDRDRAVVEERQAIARELHDVIGHTLATIAVRAEAADRVATNRPEEGGRALEAIAAVARSSLDETRRVLAGLRAGADAEFAPHPDTGAIRILVDDLARAGADVRLDIEGDDRHPPTVLVAAAAHRIVQEALTNAVKHGGVDVAVTVEMTCSRDAVTIAVCNAVEGEVDRGAGSGLDGMAERVHVLGGRFEAGRRGDQFVVEAWLPTTSGAGS